MYQYAVILDCWHTAAIKFERKLFDNDISLSKTLKGIQATASREHKLVRYQNFRNQYLNSILKECSQSEHHLLNEECTLAQHLSTKLIVPIAVRHKEIKEVSWKDVELFWEQIYTNLTNAYPTFERRFKALLKIEV